MMTITTTAAPDIEYTIGEMQFYFNYNPVDTPIPSDHYRLTRAMTDSFIHVFATAGNMGCCLFPVMAALRFRAADNTIIGYSDAVWLDHPDHRHFDSVVDFYSDDSRHLHKSCHSQPAYKIDLHIDADPSFAHIARAEVLLSPQIMPFDPQSKIDITLYKTQHKICSLRPNPRPARDHNELKDAIASAMSCGWGYVSEVIDHPFDCDRDITLEKVRFRGLAATYDDSECVIQHIIPDSVLRDVFSGRYRPMPVIMTFTPVTCISDSRRDPGRRPRHNCLAVSVPVYRYMSAICKKQYKKPGDNAPGHISDYMYLRFRQHLEPSWRGPPSGSLPYWLRGHS